MLRASNGVMNVVGATLPLSQWDPLLSLSRAACKHPNFKSHIYIKPILHITHAYSYGVLVNNEREKTKQIFTTSFLQQFVRFRLL